MAPRDRNRARQAFTLASAASILALWIALGPVGAWGDSLLNLVWIGAIVAIVVGITRLPRGARGPWILIDIALVAFLAAAALRSRYHALGDLRPDRSLVPDMAAFPAYLMLCTGLAMLVRRHQRGVAGAIDAMLDALVTGLATLATLCVLVMQPALGTHATSLGTKLSMVAYIPFSAMLLVLACRMASAGDTRSRGWSHVASVLAMAMVLVGDVIFALTDSGLVDIPARKVMLPYAFSFAAIIFCALHPSFVELSAPTRRDTPPPSGVRIATVGLSLVLPAFVAVLEPSASLGSRLILAGLVVSLATVAAWRVLRALLASSRSERRLRHMLYHDALTGDLNRAGLLDSLDHLAPTGPLTVAQLGIDRFKLVNDTFGHDVGDRLLLQVSARLRELSGPDDLVARLGGDVFAVITDREAGPEAGVRAGERLRTAMRAPFDVDGIELLTTVGVGVSEVEPGDDPQHVLRETDSAMHRAKRDGGDAVSQFEPCLLTEAAEWLAIEHDLRHAVDRDEMRVYFQPIVGTDTRRVRGFEALMRWEHPERGLVSPLDFIPVAEESGSINVIGAWIMAESLQRLAALRGAAERWRNLYVSVNVSARQLRDPGFTQVLRSSLHRARLPGDALLLELTESVLAEDDSSVGRILREISAMGVRIAIDDFGTGYSSLAYIQRYPIDVLKIDRAFVTPLHTVDDRAGAMVGGIVAMARSLGVSTIAEGVETQRQRDIVAQLGCDHIQGYLYSKPVPTDQALESASEIDAKAPPSRHDAWPGALTVPLGRT
ncbi:MAG: EAL domain-containing protein [Microthrixaceae bacterium]